MFKDAVKKIDRFIGYGIEKACVWCENHNEQLAFIFTHVVLPAGIGIVAGSAAAKKNADVIYILDEETFA